MNPFEYQRAEDAASAVTAVRERQGATFLGGGTALVDLMKEGAELPTRLVDVSALGSLEVTRDGEQLVLGAAASNTAVAYSGLVEQHFPALSQAILSGASPQLRNRATVAGNLMQRTRCPYFRGNGFACNKRKPGSGCAALEGYNRYHAVLGVSPSCIAAHPSDLCVALMLSQARLAVEGVGGSRQLGLEELYRLPGKTPWLEHNLADHDLIREVRFRAEPLLRHSIYLKVRDRASYAFALVSVAAAASFEGDTPSQLRVALGGVGAVPWRARRIEEGLLGKPLSQAAVDAAVAEEFASASLREHNAFKFALTKRAVWRALSQLLKGAPS
ncbi:MAG: xanthine dehydrogenase family protein subunit M [Vulcanimicrobiota bacterium]